MVMRNINGSLIKLALLIESEKGILNECPFLKYQIINYLYL